MKKLTKLVTIASVLSFGCSQVVAWAGEFPPQDELAQAVYRAPAEPEQDMLETEKLSYPQARAKALALGKPLVCWVGVGDVVCPACVKTLSGEVVSHLTPTFAGVVGNAIVVGVPDGQGDLEHVATITRWTTGDATWGHVPSVRRAVAAWRDRRVKTRGGWSDGGASSYQTGSQVQVSVASVVAAPVRAVRAVAAPVFRAAPMMRLGGRVRAAGCSS